MTVIDRTTYDKARLYPWDASNPNGSGYWPRAYLKAGQPTKICVHTTNGNKGSSFSAEANYLYTSLDVSAHYIVGKLGECARFLIPADNIAWTEGECIPGFSNADCIGIECHYTPGESWTVAMHQTLSDLVLELCTVYPTIGNLETSMVTHRVIALPPGRKSDPDGFSDLDFGTWRASLQCRRAK